MKGQINNDVSRARFLGQFSPIKYKYKNKANYPNLQFYKDASLASNNIEAIITKNRRFNLRSDCLAFQLHEKTELPTDSINLLVDPSLISSKLFPAPGAIAANEFGSISTRNQAKRQRFYKVLQNTASKKEQNLDAWLQSTANPANRVKENFFQSLRKKNSKEINPFLLKLERDQQQSAEDVKKSFLSNIEKFKTFPVGTNESLLKPRNATQAGYRASPEACFTPQDLKPKVKPFPTKLELLQATELKLEI